LTVDLDISLHPTDTRVRSKVVYERRKGVKQSEPLVLDGDELVLSSVKLDGKALEATQYAATADKFILALPPKAARFALEIETRINPSANTKLMGLYRSGGNYCTQCEAEGFRRITYFTDRPDVMAVYTTRIEADSKDNHALLANGNPLIGGTTPDGKRFAEWYDPHPKPSYLFALVAGNLDAIHRDFITKSGRKVRLGVHVERGKAQRAAYAMDALIRAMQWDERAFGREYDLDVFNIVAVPDFNMGAMENKGLNIFNDKYILADPETATDWDYAAIERIVAHEYFHNWTGNRITCRDWFQLCLKEGLTVYRDQEFTASQRSRPVQRITDAANLRANQFAEDAGPLAHPVRPDSYREINNFYTTTVYEKGAEVVRMLATLLGPQAFAKGMAMYFKRHDGEAATVEQFLACFKEASGRNLAQFSLWYSQAGTPVLPVIASHDAKKKQLTVDISQALAPSPGQAAKKPMHIPLRVALFDGEGREIKWTKVAGAECAGDLLHLTQRRQKIVFQGVAENPAISLNRDFSAPVIVELAQSPQTLALLALTETDGFARWQAFQDLAMRQLAQTAKGGKGAGKWDAGFLGAAAAIAAAQSLEPAFRARILTLPAEGEIAQAIGINVDPGAIFNARFSLMKAMGKALAAAHKAEAPKLATPGPFDPSAATAGKRALRNLLLSCVVAAKSPGAELESLRQFANATNMTDKAAAMQRIVHLHDSETHGGQALAAFEKAHGGDPLAMDKWFMVQAMAPGPKPAARMKALMKHAGFSLANPNRVRATLGAFANGNASGFNAASGEGYRLVGEAIREIDAINPQVAARLATAFRSFRMLEPKRRGLAKGVLEEIRKRKNLSRDLSEIVDRILGG
jgi:aminopeptidase N